MKTRSYHWAFQQKLHFSSWNFSHRLMHRPLEHWRNVNSSKNMLWQQKVKKWLRMLLHKIFHFIVSTIISLLKGIKAVTDVFYPILNLQTIPFHSVFEDSEYTLFSRKIWHTKTSDTFMILGLIESILFQFYNIQSTYWLWYLVLSTYDF